MAIPDGTHDSIVAALHRFDQEFRNTTSWLKWTQDPAHKFAIEYQDRLYPVKKIISLATGVAVSEFSGGDEANSYAETRGFKVTEIHSKKHWWIFQSNPKYYDVIAAMQNLDEIRWQVAQNKNKIHVGDRVLLWEGWSRIRRGRYCNRPDRACLHARE